MKFGTRRINRRQFFAMFIAGAIREAMEDFHCEHLTDRQMAELNPVIRNAIYSALTAAANNDHKYVSMTMNINCADYWENPRLNKEYIGWKRYQKRKAAKQQ